MFRTFVSPGLFSFPNFQFLAAPKIPTHEKYHKRRAAQKPTVQERSPQSGPLCFATNQRVDATINLVTLVTCRWLSLDCVTATTMAAMVAALGGRRRRGLSPPDPPAISAPLIRLPVRARDAGPERADPPPCRRGRRGGGCVVPPHGRRRPSCRDRRAPREAGGEVRRAGAVVVVVVRRPCRRSLPSPRMRSRCHDVSRDARPGGRFGRDRGFPGATRRWTGTTRVIGGRHRRHPPPPSRPSRNVIPYSPPASYYPAPTTTPWPDGMAWWDDACRTAARTMFVEEEERTTTTTTKRRRAESLT